MQYFGHISKMSSKLEHTVLYTLNIGNNSFKLNDQLGENIKITFDGLINCIECGSKIKKTYMQGYCYRCFITSPKTSDCIFKPHLCKAHIGKSRNIEWSKKNCLVTQYVYLSLTSNLKVGVTRESQIPIRWIDQGAHKAILFAKTPNRYLAGMIEIELSKYISDRTNWRKMLQGDYEDINLQDKKEELSKLHTNKYLNYLRNDNTIINFTYTKLDNPNKIKSLNIEKPPSIKGTLRGIKGQYLILDNLYVFNVRKYTGYYLFIDFN